MTAIRASTDRDGAMHLVMSPLELMARLAALLPRPGLHPSASTAGRCAAPGCGADDRQALEKPCRHIARPALANEGVQTNATGQVVLKLKTPWRDGATPPVTSPPEFMQRLAALVQQPRPCPPMTASRLPISAA